MSSITKPVLLDETGKRMVDEMRKQTVLMTKIAGGTSDGEMSWEDISYYVRNGLGPDMFRIGDQFIIPWKDKHFASDGATEETPYDLVFDVVHHGKATLEDGSIVPAMYLQMHHTLPFALEFDASEGRRMRDGFELFQDDLYYFTINGSTYTQKKLGTDIMAEQGTTYYESEFGVLYVASYFNMNVLRFGNPSWETSNIRAYLTKTQRECENDFEYDENFRPLWREAYTGDNGPAWYQDRYPFLDGFDEEFKRILKPIQIKTRDYNVDGVSNSSLPEKVSITYDKFFLPSREQMYLQPRSADRNGEEPFEYWKKATGLSAPLGEDNYNSAYCFYDGLNAISQPIVLRGVTGNRSVSMTTLNGTYRYSDLDASPSSFRGFTPVCAIC